ncbi:hemerythrin domain-containing protein [Desulfallas thermosapovorans]|uniref:Hemerythrin HHE cation binding domain-containing protein n=1 Tax=Desulfallas thermosapovorans DSM 6562 TaxID=1121431 RepID=A0A5S4ZPF7_9FIRM|nr:hemerythrin domain-containing protein [Desulfallas thermosapovorans]TYO94421.1 hemerythrin HHE cation binding domain-containing protein [Desulfallas thermosapovorans DSM 6562]
MDLTNLKRQHKEILALAASIKQLSKVHELEAKAMDISMELGKLSGKVSVHLSSEDKFLYPSLLSHPNDKVKAIARRFINEMSGISKVFYDYKTKYLAPSKIKANPEQFSKETDAVFAALQKRIELEEKELYPLLAK